MAPTDAPPTVIIFGSTGQLGTALTRALSVSATLRTPTSREVPFDDTDAVARYVRASQASVVVNAAAYTAVDAAETDRDRARLVNAESPGAIALACADIGARFVHVSTDYVFDGTGRMPYRTDAPPRPVNVYGETKLEGERRIQDTLADAVIVRTAWLHAPTGTNFVKTAVSILGQGGSMRVVDDQVGTPTVAASLADVIVRVLARPTVYGVLHATDAGAATWFDVACCVLDTLQQSGRSVANATVIPVSTSEYPRAAARPSVSILDTHTTRLALEWTPPHWRTGVASTTRHWMTSIPS